MGDYAYFPVGFICRNGYSCSVSVMGVNAVDTYAIAGLIGVSVFLVSFVIAVLIAAKSKY